MSNDQPTTPPGAPEEPHPYFSRPPRRPAPPPDAGAEPTPAAHPPHYGDAAPGYPALGQAAAGQPGGEPGYPGQAVPHGLPADGSGHGGYQAYPAASDATGAGAADPGAPTGSASGAAPGGPGAGGPAMGGPVPDGAGDRTAAGLPRRAGRRSLIGAFGTPATGAQPPPPTPGQGGAAGPGAQAPGQAAASEAAGAENAAEADAAQPSMTTRASIKIPGSRPIPPIVLHGQARLDRGDESGDNGNRAEGAGGRPHDGDDADAHGFPTGTPYGGGSGQPPVSGARREPDDAPPPASAKRRRRRLAIIASAAVFALVGGVYGGSLAYAGGGVPRGTSVLGVDIGGRSKSEAVRTLESVLGERAYGMLPVKLGDKDLQLDPPNAGLILDARATVDRAAEKSFNPLQSIPALFGEKREIEPLTIEDPAKLAAALEQLAADAGEHQREGGVSFAGGKATAITPQAVQVLDTPAAVAAVRDAYLDPDRSGPVILPTRLSTPTVSQEEVDRAMREFAIPAMSGPVTLKAGKATLKLQPATIAKYLSMEPDPTGHLAPKIDAAGLQEELGDTFSAVGEKPVDATFKVDDKGKVAVVPHKAGQGVSGDTAAKALLDVLTKTSGRTAQVTLGPVEPEFTTAKAEALGITEVVSTYTTDYPYAAYRLTNIHRAADLIDGSVVMPGDTWSLNKTVGERTADNGFAKGTIINNGRFETDYGGGVSQVATTMFNAVFFGGLKDVMHRPHSFWIDRYPAGREATVAWPSLDLKWQNDSGKPIYIDTSYTDSSVTVTLLGTKKYDEVKSASSAKYATVTPKTVHDTREGCVEQKASEGFKVDVTRIFVQGGKEVRREQFHTKYDPADEIICAPAPSTTPTPTTSTPPTGSTPSGGSTSKPPTSTPTTRNGED
ncbi:VanW family protein [Yinghuangia sp. ASG 101]|uniref:VanW family protein n=1 Tax=Yinghuangia sp. ASG 101 TaxID=2896848 RepID=UPI001E6092AA|nr:VanW family protein [Yinghuangia sp. ASG 101]UGQ09464.1 VanW family protein [Yinghuangia sp. ASG 101]